MVTYKGLCEHSGCCASEIICNVRFPELGLTEVHVEDSENVEGDEEEDEYNVGRTLVEGIIEE
jgi:hypothetical protein